MSLPGVEPVLPSWKLGVVTASPPRIPFVLISYNSERLHKIMKKENLQFRNESNRNIIEVQVMLEKHKRFWHNNVLRQMVPSINHAVWKNALIIAPLDMGLRERLMKKEALNRKSTKLWINSKIRINSYLTRWISKVSKSKKPRRCL